MTITKTQDNTIVNLKVEGRLDSITSPQLDEAIKSSLEGTSELNIDFSELDYISSAGLRVLLSAQKVMNQQGKMTVAGSNEAVLEVFDVSGFSTILTLV